MHSIAKCAVRRTPLWLRLWFYIIQGFTNALWKSSVSMAKCGMNLFSIVIYYSSLVKGAMNAACVCKLRNGVKKTSVADPKLKFRILFRIRIRPEVSFGSGSGFGSGSRSETGQIFFYTKIFTQPHLQGCPPSALWLGYEQSAQNIGDLWGSHTDIMHIVCV